MTAAAARRRGLQVTVTSHTRRPTFVPGLADWLRGAAPARSRGEVSLAFVTDAAIRALNRQHRRTDAPNDVLSIPSDEPRFLGDIVIAAGVARRQARRAGHGFGVEARVLALHGLLHLLGHDHETDQGQMGRL